MGTLVLAAVVVASVLLAATVGAGTSDVSAVAIKYRNCTALDERYPHGVGRVGARDSTSGTPVTTFRRSNRPEPRHADDRELLKLASANRLLQGRVNVDHSVISRGD